MKNKIVVGVSSNRDIKYLDMFIKHIKKTSGCPCDVFVLENHGQYSLTKAYNTIWDHFQDIEDSVLVLIHHDIKFKTNGWGKNLINIFNSHDVDILGVAGSSVLNSHGVWWLDGEGKFNQHDLWGKVWHKKGNTESPSNFSGIKRISKAEPVAVIDGVFMAINPNTCERFDEDFTDFHFYDVSFCIKNYLEGKKICVTETIPIVHESGGALNEQWEMNRVQLTKKYNIN